MSLDAIFSSVQKSERPSITASFVAAKTLSKLKDLDLRVCLMQGIQGSGKTHIANEIKALDSENVVVVSADAFFTNNAGVFKFDAAKLPEAHAACAESARAALHQGKIVVVDNCNINSHDASSYITLHPAGCAVVRIMAPTPSQIKRCFERNVHDVPFFAVERTAKKFEKYDGEFVKHVEEVKALGM